MFRDACVADTLSWTYYLLLLTTVSLYTPRRVGRDPISVMNKKVGGRTMWLVEKVRDSAFLPMDDVMRHESISRQAERPPSVRVAV